MKWERFSLLVPAVGHIRSFGRYETVESDVSCDCDTVLTKLITRYKLRTLVLVSNASIVSIANVSLPRNARIRFFFYLFCVTEYNPENSSHFQFISILQLLLVNIRRRYWVLSTRCAFGLSAVFGAPLSFISFDKLPNFKWE